MKVINVHFWGDACNVTGSVEKVLDGFARGTYPGLEVVFASLGSSSKNTTRHGKRYLHFIESWWRNKLFNKILGLGVYTYPALIDLINSENPDILHFHNRHELVDGIVGRLDCRPLVICHYHRRFRSFSIPEKANLLLAVSEDLAGIISAHTRKPVDFLYNPIPVFDVPSPDRVGSGSVKILYAGGAQYHKGYSDVLTVLELLKDRSGLDFIFCGPKMENEKIDSANIVNLGMLQSDDFKKVLADSDIVLMPSEHEGFSLLALEVLSSGKLLVATRNGGLAELLPDGYALECHFGNPSTLFNAIEQALTMLREKQSVNVDLQRFSVQSVAAKLKLIYERLS